MSFGTIDIETCAYSDGAPGGVAWWPDLPGVFGFGDTPDDAADDLVWKLEQYEWH